VTTSKGTIDIVGKNELAFFTWQMAPVARAAYSSEL
jgi:hypothetical protein